MQHFAPSAFESARPLGGAWHGDPALQRLAMERMDTALRRGKIGDRGWNYLKRGRGCPEEIITQTAGEPAVDVAGKLFNFPETYAIKFYKAFDNFGTLAGRRKYCAEVLALIVPGTNLEDVAEMMGRKTSFKVMKQALVACAPAPSVVAMVNRQEAVANESGHEGFFSFIGKWIAPTKVLLAA